MASVAPAAGWRTWSASACDIGHLLRKVGLNLAQRRRPVVRDSVRSDDASAQQIHRHIGATHHRIARLLSQPADPREVDADQAAAPFPDLAGDEYGFDMPRVHQIDDSAGRVVERPDIE